MFSVVIPTCNRNQSLTQCLERLSPSIQTLDSSEYEVIVTDDGRGVTSQKMIRKSYPWVKWVAGPRKGPAANRNSGAKNATGEFIIFTDDDCLPQPNWLEAYARSVVDSEHVYEGKTICTGVLKGPYWVSPTNLDGGRLWSCNMMVRRSVFEMMGGFDEGFPHPSDEDSDFAKRLIQANYSFKFVEDAVIDHPPVRRPWGRRSARLWESKIRMWYKHEQHQQNSKKIGPLRLIYMMLRLRMIQVQVAPFHVDSLIALVGIPSEIVWAVRHLRSWHSKHQKSFM